jgi:hypothetical protein
MVEDYQISITMSKYNNRNSKTSLYVLLMDEMSRQLLDEANALRDSEAMLLTSCQFLANETLKIAAVSAEDVAEMSEAEKKEFFRRREEVLKRNLREVDEILRLQDVYDDLRMRANAHFKSEVMKERHRFTREELIVRKVR